MSERASIKCGGLDTFQFYVIQTPNVNSCQTGAVLADSIGKGLHPTKLAEHMLDYLLIKTIFGEAVLTRKKGKILNRYKGKKKTLHAAVRAVTGNGGIYLHLYFVAHFSAVASAGVGRHG